MKTKPTVKIAALGGDKDTIKSHPSYGMIGICHVHGSEGERLFGSELPSRDIMRITIKTAEEHWRLHERKFFANNTVTEDYLTAAQFATFLTTPNMGDGVPCTLKFTQKDGHTPECEDEETVHELIQKDLADESKKIVSIIESLYADLQKSLDESKLPAKTKKELLEKATKLHMEITANMPFILKQHQEAADNMTASAKAEIEASLTSALVRIGLKTVADLRALQIAAGPINYLGPKGPSF